MRLGTLFIYSHVVVVLDQITLPECSLTSIRPLGVIRRSFNSPTTPLFMLDTSGFDGFIVPKTGISMENTAVNTSRVR